jgi:hypothetical protein
MHNKPFFEQSYTEWHAVTGLSQKDWVQAGLAEWDRIKTSLTEAGHWHEGKACAEVRCSDRRAS